MADILPFPSTLEHRVRLEAVDLHGRRVRSRIARLRQIDKATIHEAVRRGAPLAAAMEEANVYLSRIKERLAELDHSVVQTVPAVAIGGRR